MSAYSCILGAFSVGIIMFASGQVSWKDLSTVEQLKLIGTGSGILAAMAVKIGQRAALVNMLKPTHGLFQRIKLFCYFPDSEKVVALTDTYLTNSRFQNWFIGEAGLRESSLQNAADAARLLGYREAEDENMLAKLFGRNLDTTLVRTLGVVFAIAGIVTSSIDLHKGGDEMTQAANALFLAGSCADLIAIGTGIAEFSMASSILGVAGAALAVAGFIVIMIECTKAQPTPIEAFAKDQANKMGFYMPEGYDIDSFEVIPASGDKPSMVGANLFAQTADHSVTFHPDSSVSLGEFDGAPSNCLGLDVDEWGNVRLYTFLERSDGGTAPLYLTHCADGSVKALPLASDNADTSQIWIFKATGKSARDGSGYLTSAEFQVKAGENLYLIPNSDETGLTLCNAPAIWTVEIKPAKAAGLGMSDVTLHTYDRDRTFRSHLMVEGSSPKHYAITPDLPDFLEFDAKSGTFAQKKGVAPVEFRKSSFSLSLTDALGHNLSPAEFTLEVVL